MPTSSMNLGAEPMDRIRTRVLFLVPSLKVRGAERMIVNLVNGLDRHLFSNCVVSLSDDNPLAQDVMPGAARFLAVPRESKLDFSPVRRIRQIAIEEQISSIVALDIFSFLYVWLALRGVRMRPAIHISIHNSKASGPKDFVKNLILARLLAGDERFLSVCNSQADYWARAYHIPRAQFLTIYNGIDTEFFCPEMNPDERARLRSELNIPSEAYVVLQVASLTPEKCHEDSLRALHSILAGDGARDYYLVLVGGGLESRIKKLRQMADGLGLSERVRFCGVQRDMKQYYLAADVFTLTSSIETFPLAALEAMSMGLPCILTDVGGTPEMVEQGVNGSLVKPHDPGSIAQGWAAARQGRNHLTPQRIRQLAIERFSLSKCIHEYQEVLRA